MILLFGKLFYFRSTINIHRQYSYFCPYDIIKNLFDNEIQLSDLRNNINRRNMKLDLTEISELITKHKRLINQRNQIDVARAAISKEISLIKNNLSDQSVKQAYSLNIVAKILREDLKVVKLNLQNVEKRLSPMLLQIPNVLDEITPNQETDAFVSDVSPSHRSEHHLKIGESMKIIEYFSPVSYFLKNNAAIFENDVVSFFVKELCDESFQLFSNPDFSRSIIKALSNDIDNETIFSLGKYTEDSQNDYLYLNGGASILPFLSFFFKTVINTGDLPLKLVSEGRHYCPVQISVEEGLYCAFQSASVQIFSINCDKTIKAEFSNTLKTVIDIYDKLDIPFKAVFMPANTLLSSESLRVEIQVYSSHFQTYKTAGHLSLFNDYLSKRINLCYSDNTSYKYANVISGRVLIVPTLLASVIEFNPNHELLTNSLF